MSAVIWPIICMIIGLSLLILEVFLPSGGLIGFLALGFLGVSLWQAFAISTGLGLKFLLTLWFILPFILALAMHLWPKTPLARKMILAPPELNEEEEAATRADHRLDHLIGQMGRTLTPLRPSGLVDFEGRRIDGLAEEGLIPRGALVQAVQVRGNQLVVRLVPDHTLDELMPGG